MWLFSTTASLQSHLALQEFLQVLLTQPGVEQCLDEVTGSRTTSPALQQGC